MPFFLFSLVIELKTSLDPVKTGEFLALLDGLFSAPGSLRPAAQHCKKDVWRLLRCFICQGLGWWGGLIFLEGYAVNYVRVSTASIENCMPESREEYACVRRYCVFQL